MTWRGPDGGVEHGGNRTNFPKWHEVRCAMHLDSAYFEQESIWDSDLTDAERDCIELVERFWPADACTMLDVGAGAGRLLNNISVNATAVACDLSVTALKRVRGPSVAALATALPFHAGSFDLSLCSNVLEHLTELDLARAFGELARIARKYVMIISPIGEPIETQLTTCRRCGCQFHPNGHRRRFDVPDFEAQLPEFLTERVSFFAEPFLTASPLAAAAERALGRDIHHYTGAMCPNCNWVAPLASPPEPPGPALWDLGLRPRWRNPSERCLPAGAIPSSAIVLLRRRRRAGGAQRIPRPPKLRIAASEHPLPAVSLAARPSTRIDLGERVGTLGPAPLTGCVLFTPDSAWRPLPDAPDLRIEGGSDNGYAIFCLPAEEVTASREIRLEISGSLDPGIQVELHDTLHGYIGLGSIGPVEPARAGDRRTVAIKLPALPRPGGFNALFRLFRPARSVGWIEVHAIELGSARGPQTRPLTEAEHASGSVDLIEALTWFGGPFAVRSEGGPVTVRVDATALGCRDGSIDLGSGLCVTVPAWLAAVEPAQTPAHDPATARAAARLGHDVGLLFGRLRSIEGLEADAVAALIDAIAGASGESPARVRALLDAMTVARSAEIADLDGRVAFLTAHAEAIEARRANTERLVEARDRTIAELDSKLTALSNLLTRTEANRTAAERAAVEAGQRIAEVEGQLAAAWRHAEAIEARRATAERLAEERDRTIAGLDRKLTELSDLLTRTEASRSAAEEAALGAGQRMAEMEGRLAAASERVDAIEARRVGAERLLQERDRTIAEIEGQLVAAWTHAEAIEARRAVTERLLQERDGTIAGLEVRLAELGERLGEREAELRAALNQLASLIDRYRWFEKIRLKPLAKKSIGETGA